MLWSWLTLFVAAVSSQALSASARTFGTGLGQVRQEVGFMRQSKEKLPDDRFQEVMEVSSCSDVFTALLIVLKDLRV